jgi:asparagine synthase (glutamine-hydrolysing)
MPGIMGVLSRHVVGDEEDRLSTMMRTMQYESFYSYGSYCDKERGIFIGYTTLQGSFSDCMPIYNETKQIILFLTGEVYSDSSLISCLQKRGHKFKPNDASYLVHLFEEDEKGFFLALNGSCNGIVLDLNGNRAILFNDRYGVRRLYYSEIDSGLIFAAEAKALLKAYPSLRNLNNKSIGEYLVYDCVLDNRTFFDKINILPAASVWFFANRNVKKTKYHDPTVLENQPQISPEDFSDRFIDTFKKVLPRYFMGKTIGLGLTGGLDTRSILACMHPAPGQLPCYTFGIKNRRIYDVRMARLVAKACKQPYSVLEIEEEQFLKSYPETVENMIYVSDGAGSVVMSDLLTFNKMSRQISQVRMTGKYGTEVLKNGRGLKQETTPHESLINENFKQFLTEARDTFCALPKGNAFSFYLYSDLPWWWHKYIAIESSQLDVRSPYLDNDIIELLYQAPAMSSNSREKIQLKLIARNYPALLKIPSTSFQREGDSFIRRKFMKYMVSAEKIYIRERVPREFTHKVAMIDNFVRPLHIERLVAGRSTFRNFRIWFRDQLSQYLMDTLLSSTTKSRPFWDKFTLNKMLNDHIAGRGNYLLEIRKILQIELISRIFID